MKEMERFEPQLEGSSPFSLLTSDVHSVAHGWHVAWYVGASQI